MSTEFDYRKRFEAAAATVRAGVQLVTPEWAAGVLDKHNTRNRRLSERTVKRLIEIIAGGRWECNGEPIVFDVAGRLVDGQHRLEAVVAAAVAVPVLVVTGVPEGAFATLDQGKLRSRADVLSVPTTDGGDREERTTVLAGALGWVHRWECGSLGSTRDYPDNSQTIALLARHPGVRESVLEAASRCKRGTHSPSLFAALHYLFGLKDARARDTFFKRVWDHVGVEEGSGEWVLNKWLDNRPSRSSGAELVVTAACVIKTWNRIRAGEPAAGVLKFAAAEPFPEIK